MALNLDPARKLSLLLKMSQPYCLQFKLIALLIIILSTSIGQSQQVTTTTTFATNNCACTFNCTHLAQANATDETCHEFVEKGCCNDCDFFGRMPGGSTRHNNNNNNNNNNNTAAQYRGPDGFFEFRKQVCDTYKEELRINGNRCEESKARRHSLPILVPKLRVNLEPTTRSMLLRLRGSCQNECEQYVKPNVTSETVYQFVVQGCCGQCPAAPNRVEMMRREVCHLYQAALEEREAKGHWNAGQWVLPELNKLEVNLSPSTKTALMPCGECEHYVDENASSDMVYDFVSQGCCGGCYTRQEGSYFKEHVCRVYANAVRDRTNSGRLDHGNWVLPKLERINLANGFRSIKEMLPPKCGDDCDDYAHPTPEGIYRFVARGCCNSCDPRSDEVLSAERAEYLKTFRKDVCSSYKEALKRQVDACRWINGSWIKPELERLNVTINPRWAELLKTEKKRAPCQLETTSASPLQPPASSSVATTTSSTLMALITLITLIVISISLISATRI